MYSNSLEKNYYKTVSVHRLDCDFCLPGIQEYNTRTARDETRIHSSLHLHSVGLSSANRQLVQGAERVPRREIQRGLRYIVPAAQSCMLIALINSIAIAIALASRTRYALMCIVQCAMRVVLH